MLAVQVSRRRRKSGRVNTEARLMHRFPTTILDIYAFRRWFTRTPDLRVMLVTMNGWYRRILQVQEFLMPRRAL